jgi:hypothetical protein
MRMAHTLKGTMVCCVALQHRTSQPIFIRVTFRLYALLFGSLPR